MNTIRVTVHCDDGTALELDANMIEVQTFNAVAVKTDAYRLNITPIQNES